MTASPLLTWFASTYRPLKPRLKKKKSVQGYESTIRGFAAFLVKRDGQLRVTAHPEDLIDVNIGGYMLSLSETHEPPTVNKHRRYLLALARVAKRKRLIEELPEIDKVAEFTRDPECWSIDEMGAILDAAAGLKGHVGPERIPASIFWTAILWTVFNTGYRISALMALAARDVHLDEAWILARAEDGKDKQDQRIDLLPQTIEALRNLNFGRLPRVFDDWPYDRGGDQWKTLNKYLRAILTHAGLPTTAKDLWHKFRRVFATYITASSSIETASKLLGHSSVVVTRRYLDAKKLTSPQVRDLLPRPVARQLKLFTPARAEFAG